MANIKKSIGEQIRARREFKEKTQIELALAIGKTTQYIWYIESDIRKPRRFDLVNIEKELNFKVQL